jgi:hypothetical protein
MNKNVVVAIVSAIVGASIVLIYRALLPFPPPPPPPPPGPCTAANEHCIEIKVISVHGKPQIASIADEPVHAAGAVIFWTIKNTGSQNYSFADDNAIDFRKQDAPTPPNEFTPCGKMNGTTFKCIDKYNNKGTFGYWVKLDGSPPVDSLDPFIINN